MLSNYKCDWCGKEFRRAEWEIRDNKHKNCSFECARKSINRKTKGVDRGGKVKRICDKCGKEFTARKDVVEKGGGKFCSRRCNSSSHFGEKAHNWKGGKVHGADFIRKSVKYKEWRQSVFIRDRFTCKKCGDNSGGNLEAHHIKHISELIEEIKKYMPLIPFEVACTLYAPLWDIANGETLCETCHSGIHRKH